MRGTMRIVHEVLLMAVLIQPGDQTDHPNPPQDLLCFRLDKDSAVTCTWNPSNDTLTPTNYTFCYREKGTTHLVQNTTRSPWLTLGRKLLSAGKVYVAWVTLGEERSAPLEFIIDDIVKPQPPAAVTGETATDDPKVIRVTWTNPTNLDSSASFQFELQYRVAGDASWTEISHDEIGIHATEYELEDLWPFTQYEFRLQCGREGETNSRLWSDWSKVSSAMTQEDSPVGCLDVWFVPPDVKGLLPLTLLWKPLEQHQANGIIRRYSVSQGDGEDVREVTTCCNISLSGTVRLVSVSAANSVGATQPAKLNLVQDQPAPRNIVVHTGNHSMLVSWEPPPNRMPEEFVVEWTNMHSPEDAPDWKRISAANVSVTLRDDVVYPRCLYKVSVYARYQDGLGGPVSTLVYAEEGAPLAGPQVSIFNISQTGATLLWKIIPLSLRQGFVLFYTLYYVKNPNRDTRHKALNISCVLQRYTLWDLEPASTYKIWMTASTAVGESRRGPHLNFKTQAAQVAIWKVLVLVSMSLVFVALCFLFSRDYFLQRIQSLSSFLPQWCCQEIPDPGNSRAGLQQRHYSADLGMTEKEPEIVEVEETAPEDKVQVPLTNNNSPILAADRAPSTEALYRTIPPSLDVDNSLQASTCLDKRPADQPTSTKFTSGYEKHFMPSQEELLDNEWQIDSKEDWLGMGDTISDL
uniref:interleukin-12 receptor subunit beta-2-like n=1 Tax=Pristiophorus japonicus TaxID=55135 RepID=UPI00398E316C